MYRTLATRLVPLLGLVATLTACPTAADHIPKIPTSGLSSEEAAQIQASQTSPLPSGASPFVRPALVQASPKDPSPTPSPTLTPSATPAPAASTSPTASGSPGASPTPTPQPSFGLLPGNVGPSAIVDPTTKYGPSTR
ncbi:MAG: hypothetical protein JWM80_2232 [Cyanobacteria bacterium RYN_339]|nr:hypothetical protein [Cyanobacteria bacterium RYN_339]